jgi:hypothetical protein
VSRRTALPPEPLVSVLVPTFRQERFVTDAIASVRSQSYERLEVVVADDASPDATFELARRAAAGDPRVRLVRHERRLGVLGNFRHLLGLASGEVCMYLCGDDLADPPCVERRVEAMLAEPEVVLAASRYRVVDADGAPGPPEGIVVAEADTVREGRALLALVLAAGENVFGGISGVAFRRALVDPETAFVLGGRPARVLADLVLFASLLEQGKACVLAEASVALRRHAEADQVSGRKGAVPSMEVLEATEWEAFVADAAARGLLPHPLLEASAWGSVARRALEAWREDPGRHGARALLGTLARAADRLLALDAGWQPDLRPTAGPLLDLALGEAPLPSRARQAFADALPGGPGALRLVPGPGLPAGQGGVLVGLPLPTAAAPSAPALEGALRALREDAALGALAAVAGDLGLLLVRRGALDEAGLPEDAGPRAVLARLAELGWAVRDT